MQATMASLSLQYTTYNNCADIAQLDAEVHFHLDFHTYSKICLFCSRFNKNQIIFLAKNRTHCHYNRQIRFPFNAAYVTFFSGSFDDCLRCV